MWWFWQKNHSDSANDKSELSSDLSQFLESQLKGREENTDFEQNLKKLAALNNYPSLPRKTPPTAEPEEPPYGGETLIPTKSDVWSQQLQQVGQSQSQETLREERKVEEYKRKNSLKSAVATNCSELQEALFSCLKNGPFMDRITGCTDLAQFCDACLSIQGGAFRTLQYDSINSIRRLEEIKRVSDRLFNQHFHSHVDCADKEKRHHYQLALEREILRLKNTYE